MTERYGMSNCGSRSGVELPNTLEWAYVPLYMHRKKIWLVVLSDIVTYSIFFIFGTWPPEGLTESFCLLSVSSACVITGGSWVKLWAWVKITVERFLLGTSVFTLSRKALRQSLATVVKSVQCCVEEHYLDGLGYFCHQKLQLSGGRGSSHSCYYMRNY